MEHTELHWKAALLLHYTFCGMSRVVDLAEDS